MVRWYYVFLTSVPSAPLFGPLHASDDASSCGVGSAPTRRLADCETPVYASDAEMDDALWEDLE
jgi:hypothetical protein